MRTDATALSTRSPWRPRVNGILQRRVAWTMASRRIDARWVPHAEASDHRREARRSRRPGVRAPARQVPRRRAPTRSTASCERNSPSSSTGRSRTTSPSSPSAPRRSGSRRTASRSSRRDHPRDREDRLRPLAQERFGETTTTCAEPARRRAVAWRRRCRSSFDRATTRTSRSACPETLWISMTSGICWIASAAGVPRWLCWDSSETSAETGNPKLAGSSRGTSDTARPNRSSRSSRA